MINQRYILKKKIGEGRSRVYLCSDTELSGREFAIKILPNSNDLYERKLFKDEFFSLKKLNHPLIVKPYDLGSIAVFDEQEEADFLGSKYFTLEYFPGVELLQFGSIKKPYVLKELITQICSVLYYLHQSNYIYYDLKAENILAAEIGGTPSIKLIDLGLASHLSSGLDLTIKGTAEYIAPEILRKEHHDHRVDLYSLGILIYRIIYNRFPFNTENKLEIYKAHLEKEFEFPPADYPDNIFVTLKKLLNKDPDQRYRNSLQVIKDLNSSIDNFSAQFTPAKIFAGRQDIINILSTFISDVNSSELFMVKGSEGSGKTSLVNEISSLYDRVIPVFNKSGKTGFDFIKLLLKDIVFNQYVYPQLSPELRNNIIDFLYGFKLEIIDEMKSIISQITISSKFILVIDDFNLFDRFSLEVFKEIIPILQVNKIKVILTEGSDSESFSKTLHNTKELILNPFTETQVKEFVEKSFADFFPRGELRKIILIYSDLLPGSIIGFLHDLSFLKIITYSGGFPEIKSDETPVIETILKSSHEEIYNIRLNSLAEKEMETAKFLSAFEIPVESYILNRLLNIEEKELSVIHENLLNKNIIHLNKQTGIAVITSEGFKKYIYSTIRNKKEFHSLIGAALENVQKKDINRNEAARHYELSGNYSKSCSILLDETDITEKLSAFSYQKKIYLHLLELPLTEEQNIDIKYRLCKVHYKLNEFQNCIDLIKELLNVKSVKQNRNELLILKGSCLVELGNYEEGKRILTELVPKIKDNVQKLKLLMEIANAEFELGRYKDVKKICNKIVSDINLPLEDKGKCYNLMGLTEIFNENKLDAALIFFENACRVYIETNSKTNIANMEQNIGNIYNIKGDDQNAILYWNNSLDTNRLIGNIIREAQLLHNYGIYHFNKLKFEKAIENYSRAILIIRTLGNFTYEIPALFDLIELFIIICEYQKALETINTVREKLLNINKSQYELKLLFLSGKLYYLIGDYEQLKNILQKYHLYLKENEVHEQQKNTFQYLYYICKALHDPSKKIIDKLKETRANLLISNEEFDYSALTIIITTLLMDSSDFDAALNELNHEEFMNICRKKYLIDAEREFMLGRISELKSSFNLKHSLEYFESAYNKIKDTQVTELTWKLLFSLGMYYYKRGNSSKARDYFYYSKSVIFNIADSITDKRLKETYLKKSERKSALEIMLNELS